MGSIVHGNRSTYDGIALVRMCSISEDVQYCQGCEALARISSIGNDVQYWQGCEVLVKMCSIGKDV